MTNTVTAMTDIATADDNTAAVADVAAVADADMWVAVVVAAVGDRAAAATQAVADAAQDAIHVRASLPMVAATAAVAHNGHASSARF